MVKKFKKNPNTIERMEQHYAKLSPEKERDNEWMYELLIDVIPQVGSKVLEIGCGMGNTLKYIQDLVGDALSLKGTDISPTAIQKASGYHSGIEFAVEDAEKMTETDEYDLIINSQTLEHVDNPSAIIINMLRAVKTGGHLFITVPYPKSSLDNGVKLHYWRFYKEDFTNLLGKCEFYKPTKNHLVVIFKK